MSRLPVVATSFAFAATLMLGLAAPADAQVGKSLGIVNPNVASDSVLHSLPHVTPAIAKSLVEKRPFARMRDVNVVVRASLDSAKAAALYGRMFLPIDLNDFADEEVLLIPRVGKRMLHEFHEYQPYAALAQWHREIDKYVDDAELARLEQYVYVRLDLNTASDADILTIPGVGKRMLHEFKEYRPWVSLAQFQREIGKYVDKKELARLQRYVRLAK